ncbi:NADP-dependent oxidoreductase [Asanoa sp. NPDC050611]|uniref:NADP-dependent oxidoreductase n=1 Tax=Asanoa sp. NPDC050611 TaxID=3157098 RepID=UPI0033C3FC41
MAARTRAVRISRFGGPEVLEVVHVARPEPPPGGVVLEVRAAGVNPVDTKVRRGLRDTGPLTAPIGLGSDAAGVVVAVDPGATRWAIGDQVIARGLTGAYATHVAAGPDNLARKPAALGFAQGAAIGVPAGTAYQVLRSVKLTEGELLLVHAGSGGVGQAAIQFARLWGATVVATASPVNHDRIRELGATPVAYGPGLTDRLRAVAPDGFDASLDAAGTDEALHACLALTRDPERIATVVAVEQAKTLGIRGFSGSRAGWLSAEERGWRAEALQVTADLARQGRFSIEISVSYPLDAVAAAHRHSETTHVRGKIVLVP